MLIGAILAAAMPLFHVMGAGGIFAGQLARAGGGFLFVWTLHAMGVTGLLSLILSAGGLWSMWRKHRGRDIPSKPLV